MKLKITKREKNMIVILVGILLVFSSYYLGYLKLKEKTEIIKQQNQILLVSMVALSLTIQIIS